MRITLGSVVSKQWPFATPGLVPLNPTLCTPLPQNPLILQIFAIDTSANARNFLGYRCLSTATGSATGGRSQHRYSLSSKAYRSLLRFWSPSRFEPGAIDVRNPLSPPCRILAIRSPAPTAASLAACDGEPSAILEGTTPPICTLPTTDPTPFLLHFPPGA